MTNIDVVFATPVRAELAEGDAPAPRTIAGLAIPFGVASAPDSASRSRYMFEGAPENVDELVDVVHGHDDQRVVGRLAEPWAPTDDGLPARARIFSTRDGDDLLELARESVLTGFSAGMEVARFTEAPDGVRHVAAGDYTVRHLGVVRRPAFASTGLTVAASAAQGAPMTTTTLDPAPVALPTIAELAEAVAPAVAEIVREAAASGRHPLAQFATEADFIQAVIHAEPEDAKKLQAAFAAADFAVPDQLTTDNPGVIPPGWRTEIKMNLDSRRPAIAAFGAIGLPDAGMDASWPYLDPALDLKTIIARQAAEKTDLAGVKIKILKGSEPIKTAGTVSDISYQLLLRSSPAYLQAYLEICRAAWAVYTEIQFETKLSAIAAAGGFLPTTAEEWTAALFAQSSAVRSATGAPANIVGVSTDVFGVLGGMSKDFVNPAYGTQNVGGTAAANTLKVNVNGLDIEEWPYLAAGTAIVSNDAAAKFPEYGPQVATAEDVRKLGRDVAVWGMYEDAEVYFPAGVRKLTGVDPGGVQTTDDEPVIEAPSAGRRSSK
jgi:phage head maturation protease